jgi:predicted transcriptional regulator
MSETPKISVDQDTHDELKRLAGERSQSPGEVVRDAIEALKRDMFFEEMKRSYGRIREDDETWKAYSSEIAEGEGTLEDGPR